MSDAVRRRALMIPGTWDPPLRSPVAVAPVAVAESSPLPTHELPAFRRDSERHEMAAWLELSIFVGVLFAVMLLVMWAVDSGGS